MNKIELYLKELKEHYNCNIKLGITKISDKQLQKVPKVMHDFYKTVLEAELPFGKIFSLERALKESERPPFKQEWFVFGKDNYFSFWLCSYQSDSNGLSFTSWDHESGSEIGEAAAEDIILFLKEIEEDIGC